MKKSIKRYLAFILAFALMATYSFGPQNLRVFADDENTPTTATEQQTTEAEKAAPSSTDSGEAATSETSSSVDEPTEATQSSDVTTENTTEATTEEDEDGYPAQSFSKTANGMTITINAPEGALPEDSSVKVKAVSASAIAGAIDALVEDGQVVKAVDITFFDKKGKSIEPKKNVSVTFVSSAFKSLNDAQIVHINDNGTAETVGGSVSGSKAKFKSDEFSIYAVVDVKIVTVDFYDGSGKFVTAEFIKKVDGQVEDLFEPSLDLDEGEQFFGWATERGASEADYDTVEDLNQYIESNWDSIDDELYLYAVVKKVYLVKFNRYDAQGHLINLETYKVPAESGSGTISIPGDLGSDVGSDFMGWIGQDGTLYEEGDSFTVNSNFDFFMKEAGRFWLLFDANKGGSSDSVTYTPPQLIYGEGVVTQKPDDPQRNGYMFLGWNTEADGSGTWWSKTDDSSVNEFGNAINEDITLYAQWEGVETDYYVLFWKQSTDGESYDYAGSDKRQAQTGSTVNTTNADRSKGGTAGSEYGYYFTYNSSDSDTEAVVAANGTTVLNVYYDRREITFEFVSPTAPTATYGRYGFVSGQYVQLYYRQNNNYREVGNNDNHATVYYQYYYQGRLYYIQYEGTRFSRNSGTTTESFTGPYGSSFNEWPDAGSGMSWEYGGYVFPLALTLYDPLAAYYGDNPENFTETTITFVKTTHTTGNNHLYIYVQKEDGTWSYTDDYLLTSANLGGEGTWYPTETFTGFTIDSYQVGRQINPNGNWTNVTASGQINHGENDNVYIRYSRNPHTFTYVSEGENVTSRLEVQRDGILYGQSLENLEGWTPPNGADGFAFVGWFEDQDFNVPFDFSKTMGDEDVVVYAKWETQRCRVVLDPNAPVGDYYFPNNQALTFRIDYNEKLSDANINTTVAERPGYMLDGWYTTEGNHRWNFDTQVNGIVDGVNANYQASEEWASNAYGDNDGQHDNVKNLLKLKAKWKLKVDENSVYVRYRVNDAYCTFDANGNIQTSIPVDNTAYVIQPGSTSTTFSVKTAPSGYNDAYEFRDWVLLNADGTKSDISYHGGEAAEVDESFYSEETITDDDGNSVTVKYITLRGEFNPKENRATAVIFDGNGGTTSSGDTISESYLVNDIINVPAANTFTREGYKFVKWTTGQDGSGEELDPEKQYAADNLDGAGWNEESKENIVYAQWEANTYRVVFDKNDEEATGGPMDPMDFVYDEEQGLTANAFEKEGYVFDGWNTKPDGSGTSYADEESVKNLTAEDGATVTLYAQWKLNTRDYVIHHYLKGTEVQVKDDETGSELVGETVNATVATEYQGKALTVDPASPQSITIVAEGSNEIIVYYTLALSIVAATDSKTYDGNPLDGAYTVTGALEDDEDVIDAALGTPPSITEVEESPLEYLTEDEQADITGIPEYYVVSYTPGTLTIEPAEMTIKVEGYKGVYDGQPHGVTVNTSDLPAGTTVYYSADDEHWLTTPLEYTDVLLNSDREPVARTVYVKAENSNYTTATGNADVLITQKAVTIHKEVNEIYDGSPKTLTLTPADATGVVTGETLVINGYTITKTNVGVYMQFDEGAKNVTVNKANGQSSFNNYTFTVSARLTIEKATMTLNAINFAGEYDGAYHAGGATCSASGAVITYSIYDEETDTWSDYSTSLPYIRNAGEVIYKAKAELENYETVETPAARLILSKAPLTITVKDQTYTYNGNPQGQSAGQFEGETAQGLLSFTGKSSRDSLASVYMNEYKQTNAGTYAKTISVNEAEDLIMEYTSSDFYESGDVKTFKVEDNYNVTYVNGDLTINPAPIEIHVKGTEETVIYTGEEQTLGNTLQFTVVTELPDGLTVGQKARVEQEAKGTNAGTYDQETLTADNLFLEGEGADNYEATIIVDSKGWLKITPRPVTINVALSNDSRPYNGEEQRYIASFTFTTDDEVLNGTEGYNPGYTGNRHDYWAQGTDVGKYYTNVKEAASNYTLGFDSDSPMNNNFTPTFVVTQGWLEITPLKVTVNITGNNATEVYNGEEQRVDGYTIEASDPLYLKSYIQDNRKITATGTDAGTYNMNIKPEDFTNTNDNFDVEFVIVEDGWLKIEPRPVTITVKDQTYIYNGEAQGEFDTTYEDPAEIAEKIKVEGLVAGDSLNSIVLDGSETEVGVYEGRIVASQASVDNQDNYTIEYAAGTLTIEAKIVEIIYDLNGGTYKGSKKDIVELHEVNEVITIHPAPTREGYTFVEWRGSSYQPGDSYTVPLSGHEFTAIWAKNTPAGGDGDSNKNGNGSKTGDNTNLLGLMAAMTGAALGLFALVVTRKREEEDE